MDQPRQGSKDDESPVGPDLAFMSLPPGKLCFLFFSGFSDVLNQNLRQLAHKSLFLTSSPDDF